MKIRSLLLPLLFGLALAGCDKLPFLGKQQSALQINSTPQTTVYIDGTSSGPTPFYDDTLSPGNHTIRLMVEGDPTKDWQTDVVLAPAVVTVVSHQFGPTSEESSSYILTLESVSQKDQSQLDVNTTPENVIVKVDGRPEGFSPLHLENVAEGEHTLTLTAPGYQELTLKAQTKNGYKLIVAAMLGRSREALEGSSLDTATGSAALTATASATPAGQSPLGGATPKVSGTPAPTKKPAASGAIEAPYVTVSDTPTGWLNVRSEPTTGDNVLTQIDVGEKFPFIEKNDTGWYKIEYETGKEGWIVSRYAALTEE